MRAAPRCSWLIPVRDGGPWLQDAVASALEDAAADDEVIVVDDGSTDGAPGALRPDPRLRVIVRPREGLVAALEHGRQACRGEFVARLDADDRAVPGRRDAQVAALDATLALAAVGGRARLFADDGAPGEGMARYVAWVNALDDVHRELLVESPLFHPATTFRATAVDAIGGYRDADVPEDYDLWLRLVAGGHRLANVPLEVVEIRDHAARLTRTDARYRREAFDRCRQDYLAATILARPRRVVVWAGRRGGRPWLRWLLANGHEVPAIIDVQGSGAERASVPVRPPDALRSLDLDVVLVAVGAWGAREAIRERLLDLRPDLVEGRDWFAVL
ncbi:MAG: glycosyl transferase family 2 [Planctomycetes bacterium]|nr:glycosyl transferase family 2 [Planctomycetota bacterium]